MELNSKHRQFLRAVDATITAGTISQSVISGQNTECETGLESK